MATIVSVTKNMHGNWQAENWLDIEVPGKKNYGLRITTCKRSNGKLLTTVTAGEQKGNSFTYAMFSDYSATAAASAGRCTSAAVATQHGGVMGSIEQWVESAKQFYKLKEGREQ